MIDQSYNNADKNVEPGVETVVREIRTLSDGAPKGQPINVGRMNGVDLAYATWVKDQTPSNMSAVLSSLYPTINSEVTRYSGPQSLLRSKAKVLAVKAVKTFNPMSGAKLSSWVVTNLKPLSRYSVKNRDVHVPEVAARNAAAVEESMKKLEDELGRPPTDDEIADDLGMSVKRVSDVRKKAVASVTSSRFDESGTEDSSAIPGVEETNMVPFAQEAVYMDLSDVDKIIFDAVTGMHGATQEPASQVARRLGISPAAVSQRAKAIGDRIAYVVNNG